jgi:4-carboxymuconolactone decarboxylase
MPEKNLPRPRPPDSLGRIAPKLSELTSQVLFDEIWERKELSPRDRSLITCAALIALYRPEQLRFHVRLAEANGVTKTEIAEMITHLAFYAGWPSAVSAAQVADEVLNAPK